MIERLLNHTSGSFGGVVGVYQRHDFADEKRDALERWSRHVLELVSAEMEPAPGAGMAQREPADVRARRRHRSPRAAARETSPS